MWLFLEIILITMVGLKLNLGVKEIWTALILTVLVSIFEEIMNIKKAIESKNLEQYRRNNIDK